MTRAALDAAIEKIRSELEEARRRRTRAQGYLDTPWQNGQPAPPPVVRIPDERKDRA